MYKVFGALSVLGGGITPLEGASEPRTSRDEVWVGTKIKTTVLYMFSCRVYLLDRKHRRNKWGTVVDDENEKGKTWRINKITIDSPDTLGAVTWLTGRKRCNTAYLYIIFIYICVNGTAHVCPSIVGRQAVANDDGDVTPASGRTSGVPVAV